jgi:hypothetical protein
VELQRAQNERQSQERERRAPEIQEEQMGQEGQMPETQERQVSEEFSRRMIHTQERQRREGQQRHTRQQRREHQELEWVRQLQRDTQSQEQRQKHVLLTFIVPEDEIGVYWLFRIRPEEYATLEAEIEQYNQMIGLLGHGQAPPEVYDNEDDARLFREHPQDFEEHFTLRRVLAGHREGEEPDLLNDGKIYEDELPLLEMSSIRKLYSIIVKPFDSHSNFSLGFRFLPLSQEIIRQPR